MISKPEAFQLRDALMIELKKDLSVLRNSPMEVGRILYSRMVDTPTLNCILSEEELNHIGCWVVRCYLASVSAVKVVNSHIDSATNKK